MDQEDNFYTLKGYSLLEHIQITSSMEDYLEMICRFSQSRGYVRVHELAARTAPLSGSETLPNVFMSGRHPPQRWLETCAATDLCGLRNTVPSR